MITYSISQTFKNTGTALSFTIPIGNCSTETLEANNVESAIHPMNLFFLLFYIIIMGLQFMCMLLHRWTTLMTILAETPFPFEKGLYNIEDILSENDGKGKKSVRGRKSMYAINNAAYETEDGIQMTNQAEERSKSIYTLNSRLSRTSMAAQNHPNLRRRSKIQRINSYKSMSNLNLHHEKISTKDGRGMIQQTIKHKQNLELLNKRNKNRKPSLVQNAPGIWMNDVNLTGAVANENTYLSNLSRRISRNWTRMSYK